MMGLGPFGSGVLCEGRRAWVAADDRDLIGISAGSSLRNSLFIPLKFFSDYLRLHGCHAHMCAIASLNVRICALRLVTSKHGDDAMTEATTYKKVTFRKTGKAHRGLLDGKYLIASCSCPGSQNGKLTHGAQIICEGWERANCQH
jgi:hypothetical protein